MKPKFKGMHSVNMDAKGRVSIPARVREKLDEVCGSRIVLTAKDTDDKVLAIYPEPVFDALMDQLQVMPNMNKKVLRFLRIFRGYAVDMEPDSAGRINIPAESREYAGLDKKIMIIGAGNHYEVWDADAWDAFVNDDQDDDGEMPEELKGLTI